MIEYTDLTTRERAVMSHIFAVNADHPHLVSKSASISEIVADYRARLLNGAKAIRIWICSSRSSI